MTKDREEVLGSIKLVVAEQKRDNDYLLHIYNRLRAIEGLLLTASFGIIVYLYSGETNGGGIIDRLSVPSEDYGMLIYIVAASFFIYGVFKLMNKVFGKNPWMTAYERDKVDYRYSDSLHTIKYIKERYEKCFDYNCNKYNNRKEELLFLFYCILISAIVLVVIKTLG